MVKFARTDDPMEPPVQLRPNRGADNPSTALAYESGSPNIAGVNTTSAPRDFSSSTVLSPGGLERSHSALSDKHLSSQRQ